MKANQVLIIALLCFTALAWTNSCPSFFSGDLLESGKHTFIRSGGNRQYKWETPVSFAINNKQLELAITASTIGDYNPSSGGLSFDLSGQKKGSNSAQFSLIANSDLGWSSIQISYLASARDDFAVGNLQVLSNRWVRQSGDSYDLSIPISKYLPSGNYKVAVFISGFSTSDNQFQISVNTRSYDSNSGRLSVNIFSNASPAPVSITLSYVIYPEVHPVFQISYGSPAGDTGAYQISGPTSFTSSNRIEYNEFRIENRFLACTGNECAGDSCVLRQKCVELDGNPYEGSCIFCAKGIVFEFGICTRRCGANQIYTNRVCVCNSGFVRNGNQCVRAGAPACRSNQIKFNGGCRACPFGASPNSDQSSCICNSGQYNYDSNSCITVTACGSGQERSGNRCVCLPGYGRYFGKCRPCPTGASSNFREQCVCPSPSFYDPQSDACLCSGGLVWTGDRCGCPTGSITVGNSCRPCPSGSVPNIPQTTCICSQRGQTYDIASNRCIGSLQCPNGQVPYQGQCVCNGYVYNNRECRSCPTNSKPNFAQNTCDCLAGFNFDSFSNRCTSICPSNQVWRNNRCECISGYARYNNVCRQCPKSSNPNSASTACVCTSQNAVYIQSSNLCRECGANSSPNADKSACKCKAGYVVQGNGCIATKQCQFNQDLINGNCECKFGFIRVGPTCVEACGINEYYDGTKCLCKEGHARLGGVCRPCPFGTLPNVAKTACLCTDASQYFVPSRNVCQNCWANSFPNADDSNCDCKPGYTSSGGQCVSNCPTDASPNSEGVCVCSGGKVFFNGQCIVPVNCPARSTFNSASNSCVCNNRNENIINGVCQPCGDNSVWNKNQCVCNTGFFLIGAECRTCDPRTKYDGKDCVCNLGYFGNRDLCTPCHKSCSQCTGAEANKCTACSDVSLVLENGYCSKNSPCNPGFFLDNGVCTKCLDNCIDCDNVFECKTCAIGYATKTQNVNGQNIVSCEEICGDGIKYEQQCDDGNTANGDGCNSKCEQEPGWFCSGGSSNKPSICKKFIPDQVQLSSKGAVNLGSSVILSVRASFLPACVTKNDCSQCFKAIQVNVVNANVPILTTINFVPLSQWQFVIKFDFQGLIVTSIFKVVIKLDESFRGCFADEDYNQQLEITIDPAFLAKSDTPPQLTLADLDSTKITIPDDAKRALGL